MTYCAKQFSTKPVLLLWCFALKCMIFHFFSHYLLHQNWKSKMNNKSQYGLWFYKYENSTIRDNNTKSGKNMKSHPKCPFVRQLLVKKPWQKNSVNTWGAQSRIYIDVRRTNPHFLFMLSHHSKHLISSHGHQLCNDTDFPLNPGSHCCQVTVLLLCYQ